MRKSLIILILLSIFLDYPLFAQLPMAEEQSQNIFFDAVCFKNTDTLDKIMDGRVDVLILVPYQSLRFEKANDVFNSKYEVYIDILDSSGTKLENEKIPKSVRESDYSVTQGGTAGFDIISRSFFLNAGNYDIRINLIDLLSGKTFAKTRTITIVNFDKYRISMSGIMLISSMEEKNGRFIITPHISDNIGMLSDGFFIFFEVYNNKYFDSLDFVYELYDEKEALILKSEKFSNDVRNKANQLYKKIRIPGSTKQGIYKLRLIALTRTNRPDYTEDDFLAITERSLKYHRVISGTMVEDIGKAIRYLRYVANQSDIDYIQSGENDSEKQKRFEEFWKNNDPSPNTERNEAFDEYFSRIHYANKNFKSYTEGWLTDMGMVYIVFGPPDYTDKSDTYSTRTVYMKWTYLNNREFVFSDDTGMGDFRLIRPYSVTEKYKYGN
ncbi:MAG: GWxTD domain-containing protein [bacterium]